MEWVADEKYTRGDLDFTAQLTRIKNANPDFVIEWSRYAEGALIAKQRLQSGLSVPFLGSDGAPHPKCLELGIPSVNGIYYATHFSPSTVSGNKAGEELIAEVKSTLKKDADFVHAQAFDAITVAISAIEKAGSTDKAQIRDALRTVDFDGARGRFKFDQRGDPELVTHIVLVRDGKETNGRK
jgi:branched-chain amino acid transport system substrate-binding protein